MNDNFYRAFEEKHRGSRELIKSRQTVYLPFIDPVLNTYSEASALDMGCGRGEWLELIRDRGHNIRGMDLDQGMLDACIELKLDVELKDAIEGLKELPDESLAVITAFHIVEHIPFDKLQSLVEHAHRVLVPGGLLIMETPNPENIVVGTAAFYCDPTHQKPIPHQLLSFLPEFYGFETVKVLRLQESPELYNSSNLSLYSVFEGASPDYAVITQKGGSDKLRTELEPLFHKEYGLSLSKIAESYQKHAESKTNKHARKALAIANQANARAAQAEEAANNAWMQYHAVINSRSWRITAPLRFVVNKGKWFVGGCTAWLTLKPGSRPQRTLKRLLNTGNNFLEQHPKLQAKAQTLLHRCPKLESLFERLNSSPTAEAVGPSQANEPQGNLPPRAQKILDDLQSNVSRNKQEQN